MKFRFVQAARSEFAEAARRDVGEAGAGQTKAFRNEILQIIHLLISG